MSSFPFNKLPIELQLLVWHHARASVGQVITGDLDYLMKTITIRVHNVDCLTGYRRLLSICHISREEALRDRPVFFLEDGDQVSFSTGLNLSHLPNPSDSTQRSLAIKHWPFGYMFADILIEVNDTGACMPDTAILASRCDFVAKVLVHFFGGSIRRLHLYWGGSWEPTGARRTRLLLRTDKPVHTTSRDAKARRFLVPALDREDDSELDELREVVRQDVHCETSQNFAQPITPDRYVQCYFVERETLVDLVKHMRAHLPDLEHVSLFSWNLRPSVEDTSAAKTAQVPWMPVEGRTARNGGLGERED